jgi:lipoprotein Spr
MKRIIFVLIILIGSLTSKSQDFFSNKKYAGDPLYDFINKWWKTPYKYGGESKRGIDCSAFTGKLYKDVYNIGLPRTAKEIYLSSTRIKKIDLKDGDLVFFRTKIKSGWHVGVYLTNGWFIHSKSHKGVTISNLNEYSRIYYGAGRVLDLHEYNILYNKKN